MQIFNLKEKNLRMRGFTIVETLVAITILLTGVIIPMSIATDGLKNASYSKEQTTAIFLAQEALEYIARLRDNAALANYPDYRTNGSNGNGNTWSWYSTIPLCTAAAGCGINLNASPVAFVDCTVLDQCRLNKYSGTQQVTRSYAHTAGTDWAASPFVRVVRVGAATGASGNSAGGVPVTVTVSWASGFFGSTRSVTLQTYLYDIYARFE